MRSITAVNKGIGLRNEHIQSLCNQAKIPQLDFLELAPENWMNMGGLKRESLDCIAERYPLIAHGLSLSIGDAQPLNIDFIKKVGDFLDYYDIDIYSEHLSFSRDTTGYLYELLPIPRHRANIDYLADRIKQVQDIIKRPLVLENISYYYQYADEMAEAEFISELVDKSDCELLLDINNVYVNSKNHHYNALDFITSLPSKAIRYYHIAGHLKQDDGFLLDTHGKPVNHEVTILAQQVIKYHGLRPLLLERDHHVPELAKLCTELELLHDSVAGEKQVEEDWYAQSA